MSKHHGTWLRATVLSLFASIIFIAAQGVTRADTITFNISTTGCFGNLGGEPCTLTALDGLTFTGSQSVGIGNLGTFALTGDPLALADKTFTLNVRFNQPGGVNNGDPVVFNGSTFLLYDDSSGDLTLIGLTVHFDDPRVQTLSVLAPDGTVEVFQFFVNDLDLIIANGGTGVVGGGVVAVPEPASLVLLATGLGGLIGIARRRRKRNPLT